MPNPSTEAPYTIADHIVHRLVALGAKHVFGVPGNYCAEFLNALPGRLAFVGTTNEMEAGYAADSYSRLRSIGVVCVTYGVGSFSLLNAIAGAFVERCPVVLLNGTARQGKARQLVEQGVLFAHAIDTIRTDEAIFRQVTVASVVIHSPDRAAQLIDRALRACITERRPVYIEVRDGVWSQPCDRPEAPDEPLLPFAVDEATARDRQTSVEAAVTAAITKLRQARHPVLWGGEELQRLGLQDEFDKLIEITKLPYTTTLLGKAVVSEDNPQFVGVYDSIWAPDDTRAVVEGADCLLALGTILSDFYGNIVAKSYDKMVLAAAGAVRIGRAVYPQVPLDLFVERLIECWASPMSGAVSLAAAHTPPPGFAEAQRISRLQAVNATASAAGPNKAAITWQSFFDRMRTFVSENTLLLADTSLSLFLAADLPVRRRSHFLTQAAWLSIGYTVGAAIGASLASERGARVVVFVGDGGFQTIPQAFSTLARQRVPAIVFVFDNGLYGIEQFLIDSTYYVDPARPAAFFNDLPRWDYTRLAEAFGGKGFAPGTMDQLENALEQAIQITELPVLLAVKLDPHDLPAQFAATLRAPTATARLAAAGATRSVIATAAFD